MKSIEIFRRAILAGGLALGLTGLLVPGVGLAEGKGASKLMNVSNLSPDNQNLRRVSNKPGMNCTRCQNRLVTVIDQNVKGMRAASSRTVPMHQCPACSTRITAVGSGKAKADKVEHSCGMSAGTSGACCVATK